MKIVQIFILSILSILFSEHTLYATKFINRTERSILVCTPDGKIIIDTIDPENSKIIDIESCIARVRGDKEYTFTKLQPQCSIIFAEINGKIIITCIETQD